MSAPALAPTTVSLPVREPFAFSHTLAFLGRFPAMTGEQLLGEGSLSFAARAGGQTIGVQVQEAGDGLQLSLTAEAAVSQTTVAEIVDRVGFFLGVYDDLPAFYACAQDDPAFQAVIARLHGYHQVKFPSPLELLVWAILGQRVPMPVARTMKRAIVEHFENRVTLDGVE